MLISELDLCKREWLSLVFKNRNQQYGAYELRSHYNSTLARAMGATFFFVAMFCITETVISRSHPVKPIVEATEVPIPADKIYKMPETKQPVKPKEAPPAKQAKPAAPRSTQNLNYVVKKDNEVVKDPEPIKPNVESGPVDKIVPNSGTEVAPVIEEAGTPGGTGTGEGSNENTVYDGGLEVMPMPVGGEEAWAKFLRKNLRYPAVAQEQNQSGKVYLTFIIEKDGHLSDISLLRKAGFGFDEEALRVLKLAPAWKPGMQNNRAVRVKYTIPINFQLADQ